jgi:c-di-GMP-binding flagellar brake protein YcgR
MSELATVETERRQHPRFNPRGLKARIYLGSRIDPAHLEGDVVDISFTGIKLRLKSPIADDLAGKIRIELLLPDSGIPFSISGILKHQHNSTDLGLHYVDSPDVIDMDRFMFECIKLVKV